jgi:hypothetical protein
MAARAAGSSFSSLNAGMTTEMRITTTEGFS